MPDNRWTPPDYATPWEIPDYAEPYSQQQEPQRGYLGRFWDYINEPVTDAPSRLASIFSEPLMQYGSRRDTADTLLGKGSLYGGAYIQSLGNVTSSLTNPLNLALMGTTGGASALIKSADAARKAGMVNEAAKLYKAAQLAETPGRAAASGMIGHGTYKTFTGDTLDEQLGGAVEGVLGIAGLRSMVRNPTKIDVLDAPPKPQPKLLPRDAGPDAYGGGPRFIGGDAGIAINKPYTVDLGPRNIIRPEIVDNVPEGQPNEIFPTILDSETTGLAKIPPDLAARRGLEIGKPSLQFDREFEQGVLSKEIWTPPKYAIPEEPQSAKIEGGVKIGADVASLGKVLGSSLYAGDITKITTKELLQNSIDAIRPLGKEGKVEVVLNRFDNYVEVKDNGPGLTRQELETVFTDLGSSGKRSDVNAVGGFGLAKAAPLLGGERVAVSTVVNEGGKKVRYSFGGTPDEMLSGINITATTVANSTPTGTTVRTYVPENSSFYEAKQFVKKMSRYSSNVPGKIKLSEQAYKGHEGYISEFEPSTAFEGAESITLTDSPAADIDIIIPKDTPYGPSVGVPYQIVNQGMWQGEGRTGGFHEYPGIPENVIVNIRSKVPEGHIDYPFTANREKLRGPAEAMIQKYIESNIINPSIGRRMQELTKVYDSMVETPLVTPSIRPFVMYDVREKFTPDELALFQNSPAAKYLHTEIAHTIEDALLYLNKTDWSDKLEKIGVVFDEGLKGIHIPSPGRDKSAILINPYSIMSHKQPDAAASGILHTILHEIAHIPGGGHDESFTIRLSEIYEKFGAEAAIGTQKNFLKAIGNQSGDDYSTEIHELLQKYLRSRGREGAKIDPLHGTGIGSKINPDRKKKVPLDSKSSGKTTAAIDKLIVALKESVPLREEQEDIYTAVRGQRAAQAKKVKQGGEVGFYKQLSKLKGQMPHVEGPNIRSQLQQTDVDALFDGITNSNLDFWQQIGAKRGLAKLLGGYGNQVPQNYELKLMGKVFGDEVVGGITELYGGLGLPPGSNIKHVINETANVMKSMMASIDFSYALRQGFPLIHRKEFYKSFADSIRAYSSEEGFKNIQDSIENRPKFALGDAAGLAFTKPKALKNEKGDVDLDDYDLSQREEAYMGNWAEKIEKALIGTELIRRSSRAHVSFLNKLRADTFDTLVDDFLVTNPKADKKEILDVSTKIAHFVNSATGRGSLGRFEKNAVELNTVFFSPRLQTARFTLLNPVYYVKAHPIVRKEAIKSLLAMAGASSLFLELMRQNGATVSNDPTSADFRKAKFGNLRIDPNGGFQQPLVAATRIIQGAKEIAEEGRAERNPLTTAWYFTENKLSPLFSLIDVLIKGDRAFAPKGLGAQMASNRPSAEIINRFTPMIIGDFIDVSNENPDLLPAVLLGAAGMGLNSYEENNTRNRFRSFGRRR